MVVPGPRTTTESPFSYFFPPDQTRLAERSTCPSPPRLKPHRLLEGEDVRGSWLFMRGRGSAGGGGGGRLHTLGGMSLPLLWNSAALPFLKLFHTSPRHFSGCKFVRSKVKATKNVFFWAILFGLSPNFTTTNEILGDTSHLLAPNVEAGLQQAWICLWEGPCRGAYQVKALDERSPKWRHSYVTKWHHLTDCFALKFRSHNVLNTGCLMLWRVENLTGQETLNFRTIFKLSDIILELWGHNQ